MKEATVGRTSIVGSSLVEVLVALVLVMVVFAWMAEGIEIHGRAARRMLETAEDSQVLRIARAALRDSVRAGEAPGLADRPALRTRTAGPFEKVGSLKLDPGNSIVSRLASDSTRAWSTRGSMVVVDGGLVLRLGGEPQPWFVATPTLISVVREPALMWVEGASASCLVTSAGDLLADDSWPQDLLVEPVEDAGGGELCDPGSLLSLTVVEALDYFLRRGLAEEATSSLGYALIDARTGSAIKRGSGLSFDIAPLDSLVATWGCEAGEGEPSVLWGEVAESAGCDVPRDFLRLSLQRYRSDSSPLRTHLVIPLRAL